jgi:hypothetical protein
MVVSMYEELGWATYVLAFKFEFSALAISYAHGLNSSASTKSNGVVVTCKTQRLLQTVSDVVEAFNQLWHHLQLL